MNQKPITIGIPKGYLFKECLEFFSQHGIKAVIDNDRQLIFWDEKKQFRFMILRPIDVPVYLEHGVVDIGITGMDIIKETNADLTVLKNLGFGYCRLALACAENRNFNSLENGLIVATKFVNCTKTFFKEQGVKVDLIKLYGSVELAAITGLSDIVVDLVASGKTLQENKLKEFKTIFESTAHLVVNTAFYSLNYNFVKKFV